MAKAKAWLSSVTDWIDERTGIMGLIHKEVTTKLVPQHRSWRDYTNCFGGVSLVFFIFQIVTGLILMVNYVAHPDFAFESVHRIDNSVSYGWLLRRMHAIGSNFFLLLVFVHMLKVFFTGAYKSPRELHWVSGAVLFLMVMVMCFSGYLLPWSQLSYWASTVGTAMPGSVPVVGDLMVEFARGGPGIGLPTLSRFFAVHVCLLPAIMVGFMVAHFVMIRKTGIAEPL